MIRSIRTRIALRNPFFMSTMPKRDLTTLGLRREDPKRIWERRTALTPDAVKGLLSERPGELAVEVESCARRCFSDTLYTEAGAKVVPALSNEVDVVLGIKEPPLEDVHRLISGSPEGKERKWMMFSHTHKGQEYNTPLLSAFLPPAKGQTLIDHELLTAPSTGKDGKPSRARVAAFGWYAGAVGAGEALSMTGVALLKRGIASPILHLPRPYASGSLAEFKASLKKCGEIVRQSPVSNTKGQGPIVIGITGAGNVSNGAKDMLDDLNVEWVKTDELAILKNAPLIDISQVYACMIPTASYIVGKDGSSFARTEYYRSPEKYKSVFSDKIAPYLTTIINGVGWSSKFPRTISNDEMSALLDSSGGRQKLVAVQDITCDKEGGLEFVNQFTTIDEPYFQGPGGMLISSIDILPSELAADASGHFSSKILPYVRRALFPGSEGNKAAEDDTLEMAKIVDNGKILETHGWLLPKVEAWRSSSTQNGISAKQDESKLANGQQKKRILLMGSGLVAGPAVDVFAARPDVHLAIASNNLSEAKSHIRSRTNVEAISLDVSDEGALAEVVSASDVVVSLLPAPFHPQVAKHCISHSKHLVTASYVSPEMKALDQAAKEKDVLLLGECGLDPGIDSMAAMRILDRVKREGKKVTSFVSWCGGLPEPSASNVPLRYKFSWSPKAVLTAAQNDAHYKMNNEIVKIKGQDLLSKHFPQVKLWPDLQLEGLANRDSMPYAEKYGLGEVDGLRNLFRGTLRYRGFSKLLESFRQFGLLSSEPLKSVPATWEEFFLLSVARQLDYKKSLTAGDVPGALGDLIGDITDQTETMDALKWLSLLPSDASSSPSSIPIPDLRSPVPVDLFAHLLSHKLSYAPGERDTCILHHAFTLAPAGEQNGKLETVTASLICYGDENASAMSVTVGKTLAFAALRVADGLVKQRGVTGPYEREVWEGTLQSLEEVGVVVKEEWS
uniref:Alpha-aminoadipic semialdehyde synthase n=1 Tax=Kwoniella dejecticola CBS 10117 TaxID=1296121 RepID=A0A1A6A5F0_9TREE|nr:alpha-aminoadipic semialdehyde synthase [Kwoniella dejecticola CBS 10117]OBR85287.1 alpha-aminoadipic semialdehyde synthase [Kwoniella dejecticola CBS 10117]